jgi:hypothetical protein
MHWCFLWGVYTNKATITWKYKLHLNWAWWFMLIILATCESEASPGKVCNALSQKQNKNKRAEGISPVVQQHLPSKYKALFSIPSTMGKKMHLIHLTCYKHSLGPQYTVEHQLFTLEVVSLTRNHSLPSLPNIDGQYHIIYH